MPWWGWLLFAIFVGVPVLSILLFYFVGRDMFGINRAAFNADASANGLGTRPDLAV